MTTPKPSIAVRAALVVLRGYQLLFSSFMGRSCRFYPTCSSYAAQSLRRHGFWRGSRLALWRLLRCGPWTRGGYDPVPETVSDSAPCCAMHHATPKKPEMRADR